MEPTHKRILTITTITAGCAVIVVGFGLSRQPDDAETWEPVAEGFLAVATPCCSDADLWDELDSTNEDGQRARPASATEAAKWLNTWNHASDTTTARELDVAAQNTEVRCIGKPTGEPIVPNGNDIETINAIRRRPECMYSKWKVWTSETAERRPNERRVVSVDDEGFFHGRIDHWR